MRMERRAAPRDLLRNELRTEASLRACSQLSIVSALCFENSREIDGHTRVARRPRNRAGAGRVQKPR